MKRLLSLLVLAGAVSVVGCKSQNKRAPAAKTAETNVAQPQPYQPPVSQTAPEPEPAPAPPPPIAPSPEAESTHSEHHRTYVVRKGDTLTRIAKRHHTTVKRIMALNPHINPNHIRVGQKIAIP